MTLRPPGYRSPSPPLSPPGVRPFRCVRCGSTWIVSRWGFYGKGPGNTFETRWVCRQGHVVPVNILYTVADRLPLPDGIQPIRDGDF